MNQNAEYSAVNDAVRGQFFRKVWAMITPYWRSEEKVKAWTLLIAVIALSLVSVGISVWFNTWYKDFYNALQEKDSAAFWQLILYFCGIAAVASSIGKDRNYRGTYGEPYYNGNYNSRYGYNNYGNPRQAVEQCVRAAQRGAYGARVTDIRDVDRKNYGYRVKGTVVVNERGGGWGRDYNYRYSGRNYDQGRFTCDVQGNRVVGLDYSGLRGYR